MAGNQNGLFHLDDITHIINGCKKHQQAYQEKLYRQFYPALFALCKTFFEDNHDILTALNNGMLRVYKNIDQYDHNKGTFFNWVYSIVRNAAITLIRDKKNNHAMELNENILDSVGNNPFKQLEWKDIYYYLDKLPANTRCVCSLHYMEGFSIKEIAKAIEMKEGTVKWHLNECRTKLKLLFEQHNIKNFG